MLALERRNVILEKINVEKRVVVSELSATFDVSEETIRRDLEKLSDEGLVIKTYGGAILNEENTFSVDMPFVIRKKTNVNEKQVIARLIADIINDGEHLMLDMSSTSVFASKALKHKDKLTVITNSLEILVELSDVSGWNVIATGGTVKEGALSFSGSRVEEVFCDYNVDTCVISCKGVDLFAGVTDSNEGNANIKKAVLSRAKRRILAVDSSKFDKTALIRIAPIEKFTHVVTDSKPNEKWLNFFSANGITCIYP